MTRTRVSVTVISWVRFDCDCHPHHLLRIDASTAPPLFFADGAAFIVGGMSVCCLGIETSGRPLRDAVL